jgi:hypothetical protein
MFRTPIHEFSYQDVRDILNQCQEVPGDTKGTKTMDPSLACENSDVPEKKDDLDHSVVTDGASGMSMDMEVENVKDDHLSQTDSDSTTAVLGNVLDTPRPQPALCLQVKQEISDVKGACTEKVIAVNSNGKLPEYVTSSTEETKVIKPDIKCPKEDIKGSVKQEADIKGSVKQEADIKVSVKQEADIKVPVNQEASNPGYSTVTEDTNGPSIETDVNEVRHDSTVHTEVLSNQHPGVEVGDPHTPHPVLHVMVKEEIEIDDVESVCVED